MLHLSELKALLREKSLRLTKRLGQHHLIDTGQIERFLREASFSSSEDVVEIGAGLGALTEPIAKKVRSVTAIEVDAGIAAVLRQRMQGYSNVRVVCEDILRFSWKEMKAVTVVGAIPYSITSPLLVRLSEETERIAKAWLLMQKEVAQRLLAKPGTKAYGRLSVLCQYAWRIERGAKVSSSAFYPQPSVDSLWLKLMPHSEAPVCVQDQEHFFAVVKAAFGQRRKMLTNALAQSDLVSRSTAEGVISQIGLPKGVRGEELSLKQFGQLSNALKSVKSLR